MYTTYYIRDVDDILYEKCWRSEEAIEEQNKNMKHSDTIHIILVFDDNVDIKSVSNIILSLNKSNPLDHVVIVSYGIKVKLVSPIMQLKNDIIKHIKRIITYKCRGCITIVNKETVKNLISKANSQMLALKNKTSS